MTHMTDMYVVKTRSKYEAENTVNDSALEPQHVSKQNAQKASSFKKESTLHFRKVHSINQQVQITKYKIQMQNTCASKKAHKGSTHVEKGY